MIIFDQAIINGTVISRSLESPNFGTFDYCGTVFETVPAALIDPTLKLRLVLQVETVADFGSVAFKEWDVTKGQPKVLWSGIARRVRMTLEANKLVSLGMEINYLF